MRSPCKNCYSFVTALAVPLITAIYASAQAAASVGPDLSVTLIDSGTAYEQGYSKASLIVKNHGNEAAPQVDIAYSPGQPVLQPITPGYVCAPIERGHSGRGGGYTRVGWTVSQTTSVPLAPNGSRVIQFNVLYPIGTFNESWTVSSGTTPQLNLVPHSVSDTVICVIPPIPSAPTGVAIRQSGDSLVVTWKAPANAPTAITSSILTATPAVSSAGVLTGGTTGDVTVAAIPGVEPSTTYSVTVQCRDVAGLGPASTPVQFTTHAATIPPSPPTDVHGSWAGNLIVAWNPSVPGNSPVNKYEVSATSSDGGPPVTVNAGASTETSLAISSTVDYWQISVRAHNAAGWSDWTVPITQPGL